MPLRTKWNTKALLFSETAVKDFDTDTNCYMPEPIMRKLLPFAVAYVIYFLFENTWISKQLQSLMKVRVLENPNMDVFCTFVNATYICNFLFAAVEPLHFKRSDDLKLEN